MAHLKAFLQRNKAGYAATEVACGWAGAIFEVAIPFGQEPYGQRKKIIKKVKWGLTNRPTDRPTNQPTDKAGCRVACTRLKKFYGEHIFRALFSGKPAK